MPQICRSALVPYSAEQMYTLVNDVLSYPQFLPDCVSSKIISQTEDQMIACIDVAKLGVRKTFSTRNQMVKNQIIAMQLASGPFKKLQGGWRFTPLDESACKIEFNLDFEFSNKLIEFAFGGIFNDMTINMVQAFIRRAEKIYGNKP